jgi:hypothetical protein
MAMRSICARRVRSKLVANVWRKESSRDQTRHLHWSLQWDRVVTMRRMLARTVVMHAPKEVADFTDENWDHNKE